MVPNRLLGAIAITALFGAFNAAPAAAQTTSPGPYYASPSWDQTLPPNSRFIILSNMNSEAFLDRETGLVWARANIVFVISPTSFIEHVQTTARFMCSDLTAGNRKGWRLPLADELLTLVNPGGPSAAPLITTLGPSGQAAYWTNEFVFHDAQYNRDYYRLVNLGTGDMRNDAEYSTHLALCVRGRQ